MDRVEKRENGQGGEEGEWIGWRRGRMDLGGEEKNGRAKKREYEKVKMKNMK